MQRRTPLGVVPAVGAQQPTPCGCSHLHRTDSYEHSPIACIHSKECSNSSLRSQSSNPNSLLPRTVKDGMSLSQQCQYLCAMSLIFCSVFCFSWHCWCCR